MADVAECAKYRGPMASWWATAIATPFLLLLGCVGIVALPLVWIASKAKRD